MRRTLTTLTLALVGTGGFLTLVPSSAHAAGPAVTQAEVTLYPGPVNGCRYGYLHALAATRDARATRFVLTSNASGRTLRHTLQSGWGEVWGGTCVSRAYVAGVFDHRVAGTVTAYTKAGRTLGKTTDSRIAVEIAPTEG